jgi:hypothetical protein
MIMTMTASPFALAGLTGCGGGGGTAGGASLKQIVGLVTFPAGMTLPVTDFKVENGFGNSAIATDRSFKANVVAQAEGPTLAWLRNADKSVFMGFIDDTNNTIDARSTALVMLYFALDGFNVPAASKSKLLELIAADSTLAPLVAAIETATAVNPFAINDGNAAVNTAFKNAIDAIRAQTPSRAARIDKALQPSRAASSRAIGDSLLQISPSGLKSNLEVLQGDPLQSFIVTNHARRHCRVFTYEVGKEDALGVRTDYPKAKLAASPVPLGSTRALGIMSTIFGFFKRDTAFTPVSTEPQQLEQTEGALKTFFEVVVLGSSTLILPYPLPVSARYNDEAERWHAEISALNLVSWLGDIVFGILLEIWGMHDLIRGPAAVDAAIAAFRAVEFDTWGLIIGLAASGKMAQATQEFLGFASKSVEHAVRLRAALAALLPNVGVAVGTEEAAAGAQVCLKMFQAAFAAVGVVIGAVDVGAVLYDLANSEYIEYWNADLIKQTVRLSPASITLKPGDETTFTAVLPTGFTGNVVYKWTVAAAFAVLTDTVGGHSGRTFETSANHVALVTTPSDKSNITVTVEAIKVDGANRTSIGTAQAPVTMKEDEDVPFGSVRAKLSNSPGPNLDPTLVREMGRVRAQQIPPTQGAIRPIIIDSVHELVAGFGAKNTQLFMELNFGDRIFEDQVVSLTFDRGQGMNMRVGGPTTGGAAVRFIAKSGSIRVLLAAVTSDTATIKFTGSASMQAQDDPSLNFDVTLDGWITDITLLK